MTSNPRLPFDADPGESPTPATSTLDDRDRAARLRAVDPRFNVALEASAGTGKTRVLVDRYINLLRAGVDPANILAMTFTRKAATEMRERIIHTLRAAAERGEVTPARWRELQDRSGDIAISTIDAFCLSLLREFPLEADLDPAFSIADDTEVPRLVDESLDRALRICRAVAREDEQVALVFAQLGERRARSGLASLLARRIVAPEILGRFLSRNRRELTLAGAADAGARSIRELFAAMSPSDDDDAGDGLRAFVMSGPADAGFMLFVRQLEQLEAAVRDGAAVDPRLVHATFVRARDYFLTRTGEPRSRLVHPKSAFVSESHWKAHRDLVSAHASAFATSSRAYRHDINVLVSRGVWRMFKIAEREYRRTLDAHALLDFSDLLLKTLGLLRRMDEFARSRYRLESRYHHVLVDEFQDTSRAQWELVALLVQSWGEGAGLAHAGPLPPSIFIVGDRKQSIYGFRDADVSVLGDAARFLAGLRADGDVRRSISRSFRSLPSLLAFVNDLCEEIEKVPGRPDAFEYSDADRFPVDDTSESSTAHDGEAVLGLVLGDTPEQCADATAQEIARLIRVRATVRDITTGVRRDVRPGDVAILFRTRDSHRAYEDALERLAIPSYVYKGLGFFDSEEIRDVLAMLGCLADPASNLRAAAVLRSGFARLSDEALRRLAPGLAASLTAAALPAECALDDLDAGALMLLREGVQRWQLLVDRVAPAELLDRILSETAYAMEIRGPRERQARENLKKLRAMIRRAQNKGYATLGRLVRYLDRLAVGDESNAAIDAIDAVSLMTVHAAKGLEFPVVFVVNLSRGTAGRREPIRVSSTVAGETSVSVGDYQSASDEDELAQEREETKRLLYVALTRARDRIYLGTPLKDDRVQPGRGSLAEILPSSLLLQLSAARGESFIWRTGQGTTHAFRVAGRGEGRPERTHPTGPSPVTALAPSLSPSSGPTAAARDPVTIDFGPLPAVVTIRGDEPRVDTSSLAEDVSLPSERLLGTLVHRLVQRYGLQDGLFDLMSTRSAWDLLLPEERVSVENSESLARRAVEFVRRLSTRGDVRALYDPSRAWHEVPFTVRKDGAWIRGSIDCLVEGAAAAFKEGSAPISVLEFKTGRPRPEHRVQASLYREAVELMFPGRMVEAALVYRDHLERV